MDAHTLMVIVLQDGEEIEGTIEWYDRGALKINRRRLPNIMLLKHNIKYMYKAEDRASGGGGDDDRDEAVETAAATVKDDDANPTPDDATANDAVTATATSGGSKRATAKK